MLLLSISLGQPLLCVWQTAGLGMTNTISNIDWRHLHLIVHLKSSFPTDLYNGKIIIPALSQMASWRDGHNFRDIIYMSVPSHANHPRDIKCPSSADNNQKIANQIFKKRFELILFLNFYWAVFIFDWLGSYRPASCPSDEYLITETHNQSAFIHESFQSRRGAGPIYYQLSRDTPSRIFKIQFQFGISRLVPNLFYFYFFLICHSNRGSPTCQIFGFFFFLYTRRSFITWQIYSTSPALNNK